MAAEERRDACGNWLGTLHMQEVAGTVYRAVLDSREPRAEEIGHLDPQRLSVGAAYRENRVGDGGGRSAPNVQALRAGSSIPKNVSASLIACGTAPGTRSSITARHASDSRRLTALMKAATRRLVLAGGVASNAGPAFWRNPAALGTDRSGRFSRESDAISGRSIASWSATAARLQWPATCARRTPRWPRRAAASAA